MEIFVFEEDDVDICIVISALIGMARYTAL